MPDPILSAPEACTFPHPENAAWCVLCSNTLCTHCSVDLSDGQRLCRRCHTQLTDRNMILSQELPPTPSLFSFHRAPVTWGLCALLIVLYGITAFPDFMTAKGTWLNQFSLNGAPIILEGQYERLITGNLLHANLAHLGFNVFALLIFGSLVEQRVQRDIYLLWLMIAMLGCDLLSLWLLPTASIGASGIAYGMQSAFLVLAARQGLRSPQQSVWQTLVSLRSYIFIMILIFVNDWMSVSTLNVYGHLGGAVAGAMAAGLYPMTRSVQLPDLFKIFALAGILAWSILIWLWVSLPY